MGVFRRSRADSDPKAATEARIREAIDGLRPLLPIETVDIELLDFDLDTGVARMRIEGDCPDCDMKASMLVQGIEAHLRLRVHELREIRVVDDAPPLHDSEPDA